MPLAVRRFAVCLFLIIVSTVSLVAQVNSSAPTSGDVMRDRIARAKAFFAIKNYTAAIFELEGIKRETGDSAVLSVANVILMSCYLEQSDYKRAQTLLTDIYNGQKANKPNANYFSVAAQVVKGAKIQLERYRMLGLNVADRNLPTEAAAEVNKMRETVEMVIDQSRVLGENKRLTSDAFALLEESTNARSSLARDDYDARRWKNEVADAREKIIASRSVVLNAAEDEETVKTPSETAVASAKTPVITKHEIPATVVSNPPKEKESGAVKTEPVKNPEPLKTVTPMQDIAKTVVIEKKSSDAEPVAMTESEPKAEKKETARPRVIGGEKNPVPQDTQTPTEGEGRNSGPSESAVTSGVKDDSPLQVGSLIDFATQKVAPSYPAAAKTMRTSGTVKVDLLIDEEGTVAIQGTSGPTILKKAAEDAVKRWKFKPFTRDGQPVKAMGYVSFNFNL